MHGIRIILFLLVSTLFFASSIPAKGIETHIAFGEEESSVICALEFTVPEGYHAYSHETESVGRPTEFELSVDNVQASEIFYPKGAAQRDVFDPEVSVFVYEGKTTLFAILPKDVIGKPFQGSLSLLLCSQKNCTPVNQDLEGYIPQKLNAANKEPWFSQKNELFSSKKTVALEQISSKSEPLPSLSEFSYTFTPQHAANSFEIANLLDALLVGLLAGLLLNIMPCVLPVLTFKLQGMLCVGIRNSKRRIRWFRTHNIFFALGILTFFTFLAVLLGGLDFFWGQIFQNQTLLMILVILVYWLGLSLLGVFSLPVIDLYFHENTRNPMLKAYSTGILATLLATPCSGPLLGGVLGWSCTQPFSTILLVFWFIGFGMALPYILACIWPKTVFLLPKAGPWMNIVEHLAGFFLLGTAIYLLSILPNDRHIPLLCVLLLVSISAWLWGQFSRSAASKNAKRATALIGSLLLIFLCCVILRPASHFQPWQPFSAEDFKAQLGTKLMLVEFTADWCPNCKFVEKTVLTDRTLKALTKKADVTLFKADLTQANAVATDLLAQLGSQSIPFTAIFPKGSMAHSPIVLRDIYGTDLLKKSFELAISQSH